MLYNEGCFILFASFINFIWFLYVVTCSCGV
jgi:hypothetical protein